jgi:hypothetical protein
LGDVVFTPGANRELPSILRLIEPSRGAPFTAEACVKGVDQESVPDLSRLVRDDIRWLLQPPGSGRARRIAVFNHSCAPRMAAQGNMAAAQAAGWSDFEQSALAQGAVSQPDSPCRRHGKRP